MLLPVRNCVPKKPHHFFSSMKYLCWFGYHTTVPSLVVVETTIPHYTVFRARRITFFLVNRVENQNEPKRPQKWWPFGFVLVFNSAYGNGRH